MQFWKVMVPGIPRRLVDSLVVVTLTASFVLVGCADSRTRDVVVEQAMMETMSPRVERTFALGSEVRADGAIPLGSSSDSFAKGHEVYLSVNVTSSSSPQTIAVEWVDPAGQVVRRDQRDVPADRSFVPFSSGSTAAWPHGGGRAVVIIDGRRVTELPFSIVG